MKIISHRGNIRGSIPDKENRPSYIDCAIGNGYDVEIDIRVIDGQLWLGHDGPQYKIDHNWLDKRKKYLWIHCKNLEASIECFKYNSFCHTSDPFTYVSNGKIWLHDLDKKITDNVVIPLIDLDSINKYKVKTPYAITLPHAICTDYPVLIKNLKIYESYNSRL